jgi:hypothetical protein
VNFSGELGDPTPTQILQLFFGGRKYFQKKKKQKKKKPTKTKQKTKPTSTFCILHSL